jgi:hypothetical protein
MSNHSHSTIPSTVALMPLRGPLRCQELALSCQSILSPLSNPSVILEHRVVFSDFGGSEDLPLRVLKRGLSTSWNHLNVSDQKLASFPNFTMHTSILLLLIPIFFIFGAARPLPYEVSTSAAQGLHSLWSSVSRR